MNGHDNERNPEGSRWNEGEIGAGTTAGARRVLQSSLDSGTMVAIETAFSCNGRDVRDDRHLNRDETLPVWR